MRSFIISWFLFVETSGLLYKELETTRTFYTIVEFLWTYFIYFIYILYVKKNWNKGCIFYFFKFSKMLCWKNYEIFSWRIMMNIMPIITDLWKKMGFFFLKTLFHVNVHYFHYYIVTKRRNILTIRSTYSCIFCVTRKQPVEG